MPCPKGREQSGPGKCEKCSMGKYTDATGSCVNCPTDKWTYKTGAKSVEECRGNYQMIYKFKTMELDNAQINNYLRFYYVKLLLCNGKSIEHAQNIFNGYTIDMFHYLFCQNTIACSNMAGYSYYEFNSFCYKIQRKELRE